MAFGFPPKYDQDFQVEEISSRYSFIIAYEAAKKLNWDIGILSESGFIAYTKISWISWSEEITFKIDDNNIHIKSACTGNQIADWGKNRKNIEKFISTYNSIKEEYTFDELDRKFQDLEQSFVPKEEDIIGKPHLAKKQQISGFLSIFQARKGYFVTPIILGINLLIFVYMILFGVDFFLPDVESLILWGANYKPATLDNEWWRLVSSCFIHIGILHLIVNMYAWIYIGLILEPYLGKARFFSAYILSGIGGSVASLYWNELTVSAGASGAIFGMYGVFLVMLTTNVIEKSARKAMLSSILVFVVYNLLAGLQEQGVDNAAHIGGLISGLIFGYAFYPSLSNPDSKIIKTATIVLITILICVPSYFILTNTSNDIVTYEKRMERFISLEAKALSIYNNQDVSNEELLEEIKENGIANWEKSINLLEGTDSLDIPQEIRDRNQKLVQYCELRIRSYELIYKAISEESDEYQYQIEELNTEIEELINQLSQ